MLPKSSLSSDPRRPSRPDAPAYQRRGLLATWAGRLRSAAPSRLVAVALATLLVCVSTVVGNVAPMGGSSAHAVALPLGKERFVVSVGGLQSSSTSNWVRLGQYEFSTDGTVSEVHWHWSQSNRVERSYTEFVAENCPTRECQIQTANGYQFTGSSSTLNGTFTVTGSTLRIDWNVNGWWEEWEIASDAGGALATLEYSDSNFGATHGYGYGSNAAWNDRVPMSTIAAADHTQFEHSYRLWKTTSSNPNPHIDSGDGSPFWVTDWSVCSGGSCLGARTSYPTDYYVSPARSPIGHRRDTMWSWRLANADGRGEYCYTGNSHVKPMMQIVDDNGDFHGWVGVEASLNETVPSQGALGDDIGVFSIYG